MNGQIVTFSTYNGPMEPYQKKIVSPMCPMAMLVVNPYGDKYPVKKASLIDTNMPVYGQMFSKNMQNIHYI